MGDVYENAKNTIESLKKALATAEIKQWLHEHYGHEGVMRTLFAGIDPLPDRAR
ncbi:MAG: hypothetical protein GKR94_09490 [Gammaproteobacteria bacterium]|nr:hypothetical protein [Gammaproteobacteria bacterium]